MLLFGIYLEVTIYSNQSSSSVKYVFFIFDNYYFTIEQKMTDLSEHGNREGEGENLAMVCLPGTFIKNPDNLMTGPDAVRIW